MDINFVLYRSKAKHHLRGRVVSEIVRVSLLNNQRDGLTVFFAHRQRSFLAIPGRAKGTVDAPLVYHSTGYKAQHPQHSR